MTKEKFVKNQNDTSCFKFYKKKKIKTLSVARFVQSPEASDPRPPPNVPPVPVFWTILQLVSSDPSVQS